MTRDDAPAEAGQVAGQDVRTPRLGSAHFARLSRDQCERFHDATLHVLERTGLVVEEPEALVLLRKAGADVDGKRVRIPAHLVEESLAIAPRCVTLYDRHGRPTIALEDYNTYFGPGSDCLYCHDHRTGQRRRAVLRDVVEGTVVADALANIDFVMSMFSPSDVRPEAIDRLQMEAMLTNTTKPLVFVTFDDPRSHLDAVAMAEAVVGGPQALAERPLLACYKNTLFPLVHNQLAVRTLLDLVERGVPVIYSPVSTAGTVSPITVAGSVVVVNAGTLAGLVISQLKRPGAPFIAIGWAGEAMDMRTMVDAYAWPDHRAVLASLMHYYALPMWTLGGVTDAKVPDQQAAAEAALTLMADALAGGHMVHDLGYMESAYCGSLAQLVLCDEIVAWVRALTRPVELDDDNLALDVIDEVGPGGLYLRHKHTRRHVRDRYQSHLFERDTYQRWAAQGAKDASVRAKERVEEILATHAVDPLPASVRSTLRVIAEAAGRSVRQRATEVS